MNTISYRQMTVRSHQEDVQSICSHFTDLMTGDGGATPLRLLNLYKEVPIANPASVLDVKAASATFITVPIQLAAMELCPEAMVESGLPGQRILAKVERVDFSHGVVSLTDFKFGDVDFEKRSAVRVCFKRPVNVVMEQAEGGISGIIRDISAGGCCVTTNSVDSLREHDRMTVTFEIAGPGRPVSLQIPGKILRVHPGHLAQCTIVFDHTKETEKILGTFIYRRQIEIIKELKERC